MKVKLTSDQPQAGGGIVPKGTVIDDPWGHILCENGQSEPADDEAKAKWQEFQAKRAERLRKKAKEAARQKAEKAKKRDATLQRQREMVKAQLEAQREFENEQAANQTADPKRK